MSKEFKVGLLAVVASVMMYFGFNFLRGIDFFSPTNKYYAIYHHIDGLTVSNPVVINGLAVGRVSQMTIMQNEGNRILVELDVDEKVQIRKSSEAKLTSTDFLGSKAIQIVMGKEGGLMESGDTLISFIDGGLAEIMQKAEPLTDNLGVTISSINKILKGMEGSGEVLKSSLERLDITLKSVNQVLASTKNQIPDMIGSYKHAGDTLKYLASDLRRVAHTSEEVMQKAKDMNLDKIGKSLEDLSLNLNTLVIEITQGDGTLGKLIQDDSLHNSFRRTIEDLDKFLIHIDRYPKHFFAPFGKKAKKVRKELEEDGMR